MIVVSESLGGRPQKASIQCELSIIVVSWNTKTLLADCLTSIYSHTSGLNFEVIVVDNASVDGSPEMVAADFPQVVLLRNQRNIGFGRANNQAFAIAKGKYIALLNSDAVLLNQVFEALALCLDSMPSVGVAGPMLLREDGGIDRACARGFITLWTEFLSATGLATKLPGGFGPWRHCPYVYSISQKVNCLSGACMVIRRRALLDNLIFDPSFFMYGEDVNFCYSVNARGWDIYYFSEAHVLHHGKASTMQNHMIPLHALRSHNLFISRAYGRMAGVLHRGMWLFFLAIRYVITAIVLRIVPKSQQKPEWIRRRYFYPQLIRWALGRESPL